MTQPRPFKVLIAGGSVAGLTIANMLQANDIDFEILEAYPSIAPQVGASIGMLPHGNRILDQLGLYDKIRALAPPVDSFTFRDKNGMPVAGLSDTGRSFVQRFVILTQINMAFLKLNIGHSHGYPILFLDRQMVLQVLYDNIKDKRKVLTGKRLEKVIEMNEKGVKAITTDGSIYWGDLLIGADGVHSTTRGQMRELAAKLEPNYFDPAEAEGESSASPDISESLLTATSTSLRLQLHIRHLKSMSLDCFWQHVLHLPREELIPDHRGPRGPSVLVPI